MRVTRSRAAASKRKAADYVDLDSDEFEEVLAEAETPSSKRNKRSATTSRTDGSVGQRASPRQVDLTSSDAEEDKLNTDDGIDEEMQEVDDDEALAEENGTVSQLSDSSANDEASSEDAATSKSKQQKGKQKKPRKKRQSTRRLCASYAKAQYGLTDRDLAELRENPHYPLGPMMKLYLVRELQELAEKKQAEKAMLAATAEERALERAAAARAKRVAAAEAAAEAVKAMGTQSSKPADDKYGTFKLPETCLSRIMEMIADSLEPGGLKGPSAVAAELGQAALVCWDFYHASKAGFAVLGEATTSTLHQVLPPHMAFAKETTILANAHPRLLAALYELPGPEDSGYTWSFWDDVIKDPTALKLPQLKDAARLLTLPVSGTKAELVVRILDAFGLKGPTAAPAKLIRTLLLERSRRTQFWDGTDGCQELRAAVRRLQEVHHWAVSNGSVIQWGSVADIRKHLLAHFNSIAEMIAAAEKIVAEQRRKKLAAQASKLARHRAAQVARAEAARAAAKIPAPVGGKCKCGNQAAKACMRGCCGECCKTASRLPSAVRCQRHRC